MNSNAVSSRITHLPRESADLLEALLEKALLACERYTQQFSKVAALARTIDAGELSESDRAQLLTTLEEIASDAEASAGLDVDLFQGLLAGKLVAQQASRVGNRHSDVIVAPSTNTRH